MKEFETYLLARGRIEGATGLAVARKHGAYEALEKVLREPLSQTDVIAKVKDSGLRGRGGAGFPTGLKWSFMPDHEKDPRPRYLAVNADESEPGTCKDRVLMEKDPHGLIEGSLIGAYAMRAQAVYIYVRGEYRTSYDRLQAAIDEARAANLIGKNILGSDFSCEVHMHKGAGAYICGEETGLMESLEGKRGHPRPKPPFPAGFGLWGSPTTVNNVESLFNVPFILLRGASWFRSMGTEASAGNFLCGISGHVERPGVYELPFGLPAREILEHVAGGVWNDRKLKAWFPGGSSTGLLPASTIGTAMDHDSVKAAGSMFGTGAMIVLDETACVVRASHVIARFYDHESCGQCSQCREGTQWLSQIFARLERGKGTLEDIDMLESLARGMAPGRTICALSDAAAIPTLAVVKHFRDEIEAHVRHKGCPFSGGAAGAGAHAHAMAAGSGDHA
jgi:NADH-quinone oxidoreductase subunit F